MESNGMREMREGLRYEDCWWNEVREKFEKTRKIATLSTTDTITPALIFEFKVAVLGHNLNN